MKRFLTVVLSLIASTVAAQWSNTTNTFVDSLHMPVSLALAVQKNPIVLTSYPDGGYFVIWEDDRNFATTKTDIYAQKYDNAGHRLWAEDGIPIANGPNGQHYTFSSNQDYRNRSFVATDSAGGFYICYSDDSVSNYYWERVAVQHVRPNGSTVFPSPGYIMARSGAANLQMAAQLIPDGNKGFFIAYKQTSGNDYINVYCYRDENGKMAYYGGGRMNENAIQTSSIAPCGIKTDVVYPGTNVIEYNIWSDLQGGCNVVMDMNGNIAGQHRMLTYNRLWRAKKDSKSKTYFRNTSGTACPRTNEYFKGNVYLMYKLKTDYQSVFCQDLQGNAYAYTNYRLISNGYQVIDDASYDYGYPKGITVSTPGTINVTMIAAGTRTLTGNTLSEFILKGYTYREENFDSIPYQHTTYSNPDFGYNTAVPARVNKLNFFRDTLMGSSNYYFDFCLAGGGSDIYAAGLLSTTGGRIMRLQHLDVLRRSADSFEIEYNTNIVKTPEPLGVAIGKEVSTGFGGSDIFFDIPLIAVSRQGRAVFYTREYYRSARVSPLDDAELTWGAMGRPIGAGLINTTSYAPEQPVMALDSTGNSAIIAWKDARYIPGAPSSSDNIYLRHLDNLTAFNYSPPPLPVKLLPNPYGPSPANPVVLNGTSGAYSTLEVRTSEYNPISTPVIEIQDDNLLGYLRTGIFQNSTAIRRYDNVPYLDRNYTVLPEFSATGKTVSMLLYFTKQEFDALKKADPSIEDPGYLAVIRQENTTNNTPNAYLPVAGEELLTTLAWDSTPGGYWIQVTAKGLGNFFIRKITTVNICSGANASFTSNITGAKYKWQVNTGGTFFADLANNSNYSGVTTATLQVNNIPSSFNSYRYRCIVDDTKPSAVFYLQVGNTWTGAINNTWENAGNWSCGKVPDANTDVIINSGTVTVNSNVTCRSLKVSPGASVNVTGGFNLTVTN